MSVLEAAPAERPLHKTEPQVRGHCGLCAPHRPNNHDYTVYNEDPPQAPGLATAPVWPENTDRGMMEQAGQDSAGGDRGAMGSPVQETVPFTATELGGTALVTTKTL